MKKLPFLLLMAGCFLLAAPSQAQILKRLKEKVKETSSERAEKETGDATNKTIDEVLKPEKSSPDTGKTGNDEKVSSQTQPTLVSYQNYDFVPGDTVLFADDFSDDQDGEFPAHWHLIHGQGMVNQFDGHTVFNIINGNFAQVQPRMKTDTYLGDAFTIEFDLFAKSGGDCGYGANVFFRDADDDSKYVNVCRDKTASTGYFPHELNGPEIRQSDEDFWNHWHHIAIAYHNPQMKVYIDQHRVLVIPEIGFRPLSMELGGLAGDETCPITVANFRLARGGHMNMIGKAFTESKLVTHGIHFETDKAVIMPESMGTLNMIVRIMKNNPNLRFEVVGHTDNTGTPAHNFTLSQQRAEAVRTQLVKMGIDASRLSAKGMGDTQPMDENTSAEGRANNRRVEFVKLAN